MRAAQLAQDGEDAAEAQLFAAFQPVEEGGVFAGRQAPEVEDAGGRRAEGVEQDGAVLAGAWSDGPGAVTGAGEGFAGDDQDGLVFKVVGDAGREAKGVGEEDPSSVPCRRPFRA